MLTNKDYLKIFNGYYEKFPESGKNSILELAKKINFFVYNFCSDLNPTIANENIFASPYSVCGTHVRIYKDIAESYGLIVKNAFLFDIPILGDLSLCQVEYMSGKLALFDPSNGIFFTPDGEASQTPYSMNEIFFLLNSENLIEHVVQVKKINIEKTVKPIDDLYESRTFNSDEMKLEYYLASKAYGYDNPSQSSLLEITADLSSDEFQFCEKTNSLEDATKNFFESSRKTTSNEKSAVCSSGMQLLGHSRENDFRNIYKLVNLKLGHYYKATFSGHSPSSCCVKAYFIGNNAILEDTESYSVSKGLFKVKFNFLAREEKAKLLLEMCKTNIVELGGLKLNYNPLLRIFNIKIESLGEVAPRSETPKENSAANKDLNVLQDSQVYRLLLDLPSQWIKRFVKQRLLLLASNNEKLAFFPTGTHSKWLMKQMGDFADKDKTIFFDDGIENETKIDGFLCAPTHNVADYNPDLVVISTDVSSQKLTDRAKELFGDKIIELYEGLPAGPYCDKGNF